MKTKTNLWRESSSVTVAAPPLAEDAAVDLAVIGGGYTGLSAALHAAALGAKVAVFEAESFGHGGSGRNVGLVNAGLWLPPEDVVRQMGEVAGRRLMAALAKGPATVWDIVAREGIDCEATPNGTLHLAHAPAGRADLAERFRQGKAMGWPVELLDRAETVRRTGSSAFHAALFDPRAGTIQPLSYARGLAIAAVAKGARLYEKSAVSHARHDGDCWRLVVNGHAVRAKHLLLATNAYFGGVDLGFRPEIVAVSYFQFATRPMPAPLRDTILAGGEGCWDTAMVMSSFRVDRAGRMILGAIGNLEGPGGALHAAWARRKLAQVYPQLAGLAFEHGWRGRIAMTSDHIPKIVAFGPDALACFGYSGRGICPGTVFGRDAALALLEGKPDALPVAPVAAHREAFVAAREAYYEAGAALTHAVMAR